MRGFGNGFSLRSEQWAFMQYKGKKAVMLYDMNKDPRQHTNLAGKAKFAKIQAQLQARLNARIADAREAGLSAGKKKN